MLGRDPVFADVPPPLHTRPVVLVPGFRDNSTVFRRLTHYLQKERFDVHALTLRPSDGRMPLDHLAHQVAAYVDRTFAADTVLDFVGFSMGGIVLRYYLQRLGGLAKAEHFVTLGSPHRGTWMAYYSGRPGVRQMRPGSPFLADLAEDEERLNEIKFTSIWTPLDLTIVPSSSSVLTAGTHHPLLLPYHRALVTNGRALQTVAQVLRDREPNTNGAGAAYETLLRQ
ncbi:MAG: hypothetical protein R2856_00835 [Caldilineaceae bacterium]